ncbi:Ger(x)C family spore germination protein [Neobacillus drentensis]|uniref:Ger(x)C family spore germination protein n=1 Tax=Neobacillus drentensis TaxID=220684 RepID=UPI002855895A|nr:hypothetical protein [Neobacillus drentensis]
MRKSVLIMNCFLIAFLSAGCWDEQRFVRKSLINGISLDAGRDGKILGAVRALILMNIGGELFEAHDELIKAAGYSVNEIGSNLNKMMAVELDSSKTHIIIIGEKIAKKGIIPRLEPFYRSKRSYLVSKVIMGRESGYHILSTEEKASPIVFDILQMIESVEISGVIPKVTIFSLWSKIWEPGKDILISIISSNLLSQPKRYYLQKHNQNKPLPHLLRIPPLSFLQVEFPFLSKYKAPQGPLIVTKTVSINR